MLATLSEHEKSNRHLFHSESAAVPKMPKNQKWLKLIQNGFRIPILEAPSTL